MGSPDADIDAPEAWNVTTGSPSVIVAVIDTGVDCSTPTSRRNFWINSRRELPGRRTDGIDDDGNGYVDDWRGWDFVNNDNDPLDDHGHGTHVAGTIGAVGNNGVGVVGVNWNVKLMPLEFLDAQTAAARPRTPSARCSTRPTRRGRMNNSWAATALAGARRRDRGRRRRRLAVRRGCRERLGEPTTADPTTRLRTRPNVISVAATDDQRRARVLLRLRHDRRSLSAPRGRHLLDVAGRRVRSSSSGTSMAAPFVSGAVRSRRRDSRRPTGVGLEALLLRTVDPNASLAGRTRDGGRLNVDRAVRCNESAGLDRSAGVSPRSGRASKCR